jgi:hypothetical protein
MITITDSLIKKINKITCQLTWSEIAFLETRDPANFNDVLT